MRKILWGHVILIAAAGALFAYFVYTPAPEPRHLTGRLTRETIQSGGLKRSYLLYVPRQLARGAALVVAMHGSRENGARMRIATGYGFERLADRDGFAVVYPNGYEGYWNACNVVGDYAANRLDIDDVGFLEAIAGALVVRLGIDRRRVFAMGISRGGHMALRLAIEAPQTFRAVAAVAANVPAPENFKCKPRPGGTAAVMIMNGTRDPLNPFDGGEVRLFGLFLPRGTVLSSLDSARYFAALNHLNGAPETRQFDVADGARIARTYWGRKVELFAVEGGGHVVPQPYWRYPRLLGPTPRAPDGTKVMWDFFARQK
jgi:polyhydroxybutyrate depolymerase